MQFNNNKQQNWEAPFTAFVFENIVLFGFSAELANQHTHRGFFATIACELCRSCAVEIVVQSVEVYREFE